jgi:excinuclease UvrABC nuclease subunit
MASLGPYRPLGASGKYPDWLRVLTKSSGVYAIRDKRTKRVLYVGSSNRKLYSTITRHVQSWRRSKTFWRGMRGTTDHDPGTTYARDSVEVAFAITTGPEHLVAETMLIHRLKPRDNLVEKPAGDDDRIPF